MKLNFASQVQFLKQLNTAENMTFAQIFAAACSLDTSTLAAKSQSQSADFAQSELTDFTENCVWLYRLPLF